MAGGIISLVAYGAQDVYLTGNPQITMFKVVYRRHTNFSTETIELPIDNAKPSGRISVPVLRNADLATKTSFRSVVPDLTPTNGTRYNGKVAWVRRLGHAMIKSVEIQIGGSQIDKQYGVWLDLWYELTHTAEQENGYNHMIGDVAELTTLADSVAGGYTLFVPFQFWFCRNYGLALPLIALQYHEVRFNIEFERIENLVCYTAGTGSDNAPKFNGLTYGSSGILIDYQFLDSEERRRFAQVGHEYLIEQVQYKENSLQNGSESQTVTLDFNHPCKELIWAARVGLWNGSSDSKFLGYTADGNWDKQLKTIAENLVVGALTFSAGDEGSTTQLAAPEGATEGAVNAVVVVPVTSSANLVVNFTYTSDGASTIYMKKAPLVLSGVNLLSKVYAVELVGSIAVNGDDTDTFTVLNVNVTDHGLTMNDVSSPVSAMTDTRDAAFTGNDVHIVQLNNYGLRLDGSGNMVTEGNLVLNGHDRFSKREGSWFNYVQPAQAHTRTPADGVNVYSFALHAEQHQPNGTTNMSRIDSARLIFKVSDVYRTKRPGGVAIDIFTGTVLYIAVVNYNILRIMSGMGGLAYSS